MICYAEGLHFSTFYYFLAGVRLSLRGRCLGNKVYIGDIGEDNNALFCHTDKKDCCNPPNRRGLWEDSNNTQLLGPRSISNIYMTRGSSSLFLNRRNGATGMVLLDQLEISVCLLLHLSPVCGTPALSSS